MTCPLSTPACTAATIKWSRPRSFLWHSQASGGDDPVYKIILTGRFFVEKNSSLISGMSFIPETVLSYSPCFWSLFVYRGGYQTLPGRVQPLWVLWPFDILPRINSWDFRVTEECLSDLNQKRSSIFSPDGQCPARFIRQWSAFSPNNLLQLSRAGLKMVHPRICWLCKMRGQLDT